MIIGLCLINEETIILPVILIFVGMVILGIDFIMIHKYNKQFVSCSACNGTGVKEFCPECRGRGRVKKTRINPDS